MQFRPRTAPQSLLAPWSISRRLSSLYTLYYITSYPLHSLSHFGFYPLFSSIWSFVYDLSFMYFIPFHSISLYIVYRLFSICLYASILCSCCLFVVSVCPHTHDGVCDMPANLSKTIKAKRHERREGKGGDGRWSLRRFRWRGGEREENCPFCVYPYIQNAYPSVTSYVSINILIHISPTFSMYL
jgi:hypothetical protein